MEVFLMRHGESGGDVEPKKHEGRANLKLTEKGIEQLIQLTNYIKETKKIRGQVVFTSPLYRALQCAKSISNVLDTKKQ